MRVLLLSSRFPWPPFTGDRVRAVSWLQALAGRAEVTLVAPGGSPEHLPAGVVVTPARGAPHLLPAAALKVLVQGLPATALLAAGHDWRGALVRAERERGPFDRALVLLARLDPWVFPHLRARVRVLDAIDALGANLRERAAASRGPARAAWRVEARRTARLELAAGRRYDRVVVVAESEREAFGPRSLAIPHGVEVGPLGEGPRDVDVAFWGRLAYFANADATRFLLDQIWPVVRRARPDARLLVGGAEAPGWVRRRHGRDGIEVASPLGNREVVLRRVKVAVVPLRFGTGQSNKVLEAAEAGCAVVSTPEGVRGLAGLQRHVIIERDAERLGQQVAGLLAAPERAAALGRLLRGAVAAGFSRAEACRRLAALLLDEDLGTGKDG